MVKQDLIIEEFSDKYKTQVKEVIGNTLADISVIDRKDLPIDDSDLDDIEKVYSGKGNFWVALKEGRVVGTVALKEMDAETVKLKRMFVLITNHGDGTGPKLLNYALNYARKQGFKKIILNTHELMQRAHRFYEKNGFKQVGKSGEKYSYERAL